jgi:quercetin dioxygenase-like cupin family protein
MLNAVKREAGMTEAGGGEVLDVFGAAMVVKADPMLHGLFLGEHVIPPGYFVPPHVHSGDDEVFFLLEGELTILGTLEERRAGPGVTVQLPGGSRHGFRNDTTSPVRFLVMARPGLQAVEMFRHFNRAGRATTAGLTPPEIMAICAQYGVIMS